MLFRRGKFLSTNSVHHNADFELASIWPHKILDNLKLTIEECQLVPNSNVLIIPKTGSKKSHKRQK